MKKKLLVLLIAVFALAFSACGKTADVKEEAQYGSASEIMTAIWEAYPEDNRFSCFGGNQGENAVMDSPAAFDVSDKDGMSYLLLLPADVQEKTDDAATLVHMMNANTFTGAVVHLSALSAGDAAAKIEDAIMNNRFMCGFPEKLVVMTMGDYVLYAFGNGELVDSFRDTASETLLGTVEIACDKPIG